MNIGQARLQGHEALKSVSDSAALDALLLLQHTLKRNKVFCLTHDDTELNQAQQQQFRTLIGRRAEGEPMAYILGQKEFWSLHLQVNRHVLIPRPETELLVEFALEQIQKPSACVVDLGTGSGAIACALASEKPRWHIIATDKSEKALAVAKSNAKKYRLRNMGFYVSHWLERIPEALFDGIVTNPPYIAYHDPHLAVGDVQFEPSMALVAKDQGLSDIKTIAEGARYHLKSGAPLAIEHGYQQAQKVRDLLVSLGYSNVCTRQDVAGNDRMTFGFFSSRRFF